MRARGLKQVYCKKNQKSYLVAPHAGAWVETSSRAWHRGRLPVAPHAGAWVETFNEV